jgi:hypothetical protein
MFCLSAGLITDFDGLGGFAHTKKQPRGLPF